MKTLLYSVPFLLIASSAIAGSCPQWTVGDLVIDAAWSKATIGDARPGIIYFTVTNTGAEADNLTGIATPAAEMPMLHETVVTDGIASMPHAPAIPVPANGSVSLAPGGYHGMLMGLTAALAKGDTFPATLTFERAGTVEIEVAVEALTAREPTCRQDAS
ncbi:copper chaperone PCu(A)C [Pseudogemmobacter bohemicus]|uniref:copper chaperone PCu(A)C n=1 Tax=Pseudogemmobacter bohemicus TaxID=2250708 RepID=UPI000DD44A2B|nr:copper chaperone PCu(A)C [Pseudogemmobacter bohemicus]